MTTITSPDNIQIKNAAALKQKKFRDKTNLFLIEGIRLIETALASDAQINECFYLPAILDNERGAALINNLAQTKCFMHEVTPAVFNKLADTDTPQGIVACVYKNNVELVNLSLKKNSTFIIIDQLQDPGNIGTIIRTADAAGIDAIISLKGTVDIYSPKVTRATMGALFHLPIVDKITPADLEDFITKNNITLLATVLSNTAAACFDVDYTKTATAIAVGNEGAGVSEQIKLAAAKHIYIPMYGKSESLNASCAAAMIMYEIMRQKHTN